MNNRHRRVAKLKKQELNECGISTEKAAEAMESFEMATTVYGLNTKEAVEAKKSFEMLCMGQRKLPRLLAKFFQSFKRRT